MPSPNFYNENRNRAFPFVAKSVGIRTPESGVITMRQLPDDWIVDAGFTIGPMTGFGYRFENGEHVPEPEDRVFLSRVYRVGDLVFFQFGGTTGDLVSKPLLFCRNINSPIYSAEYVEIDYQDSSISASYSDSDQGPAPDADCAPFAWAGYLVTGDLSKVPDYLADGEMITRGEADEAIVEPALIHNMFRAYLHHVNLANGDRTRASAPEGCDDPVWPFDPGVLFVQATCLAGNIHWKEGYNCVISQNDAENSLTIGARVGAGEGEPCAEVPLFVDEGPPAGSSNGLLSGGPLCNETLRSINGIGGPLLTFLAGTGASIFADPERHKVTVDINMLGLSVCFSAFSEISESV